MSAAAALQPLLALTGIIVHLVLHYGASATPWAAQLPLFVVLAAGGIPLVLQLVGRVAHGEFGADHLAGISIVASALLGQYLAGAIVVLMLSGGQMLEQFAIARATSVLRALAGRVPTIAHRRLGQAFEDVPVSEI